MGLADDASDILAVDFPEVDEIRTQEIMDDLLRGKKRSTDLTEEQIDDVYESMQETPGA